jgi:hypothetical protein
MPTRATAGCGRDRSGPHPVQQLFDREREGVVADVLAARLAIDPVESGAQLIPLVDGGDDVGDHLGVPLAACMLFEDRGGSVKADALAVVARVGDGVVSVAGCDDPRLERDLIPGKAVWVAVAAAVHSVVVRANEPSSSFETRSG